MSILKNITQDTSIADEKDSVGGGSVLESGLYEGTIKLAYVITAKSGAIGLVVHAATEAGREIRETLWMTSGTEKGGKNYYEKDGKKNYLPGYVTANSLSLLTVGKDISDLDTEDKVVKLYDFTAKAEVPTKVPVAMDLLGKPVLLGVVKEEVDKNIKDGSGNYVPSGESRSQNVIDKVFRAEDKMTTAEIRAQAEAAEFYATWEKKWLGQVRDKTTKGAANGTPASKLGGAAKTSGKPVTSLFGATA